MARQFNERDVSLVLQAAKRWIKDCLIADGSVFTGTSLWTSALLTDDYRAFVEHPDFSADDFMTKLKRQMSAAPPPAQQLMAEALWALLLFPSNLRSSTKRRQVLDLWSMSGQNLPATHPLLSDGVLVGIGSGGTGFNHYRPYELEFLINLTRNLKQRAEPERQRIFCEYHAFLNWIEKVPRNGSRQFRHMLRFFAFPDRVERMSSNNDRRKVLVAFGAGTAHEVGEWDDGRLDQRLMELRQKLEAESPGAILDFYEAPLQERWATDRKVKTAEGDVTVSIPGEEEQDEESAQPEQAAAETRPSIHIQAKLARIGAIIGLKVWIPRPDRTQVTALLEPSERLALLDDLPINYNDTTNKTIELIDVLWLRNRSIQRAFEVEHTTAVYSGLLRMADLLALQPNLDIRLHIVAPDERREKVFREMKRPVFSLLEPRPLSKTCTFLSYESVEELNQLEHLAHMNQSILETYEEPAPA